MFSHYWSPTGEPDYRRYTVAEGDTPLPLGSTCRRKRLRPAEEDDEQETRRRCASRPNSEGSLTWEEEEEEEEDQGAGLQRLCQRCHIVTSQLNRQAAAVADSTALKDPVYASLLLPKLRLLQRPRRGRHASDAACCDVCGASYQQLRLQAQHRVLDRVQNRVQHHWDQQGEEQQQQQQQQGGGAPWGWDRVQSTYLGGGGARGLATVTPLPLDTHHDLEGVWRVSCCREENPSDGRHMTSADDVIVKPAAQSVATQTGPPPSAAATFFMRAAQKLSLSRRKKSPARPLDPPGGAPWPLDPPGGPLLLYTGGFSGALRLAPPTVPPCLLRAGCKVKDTPRTGKVRVMVRVSSVHTSESSESTSFLKVDSRKKQLTLCKMASSSSSSSSSGPKTFTFDGVFSQDASQAEVCSGALADVLQSVANGADGCVFCFGPANLGKTYTMIGRECSTHSLGVAPTAISWLFRVMEEREQKCGVLFSVRVSAVEISGREETLTDLLAEPGSSAGSQQEALLCLTEDPLCGCQLQNQTDLVASSAEQAASFLDLALAARTSHSGPSDVETGRNSHFLFTLHVRQERSERGGKAAVCTCSRLHLLDLGSCETDACRSRRGGGAKGLTLSALGNVILALVNGAKHVPYRDRKLTMLLRVSLGNVNCRTAMMVHVCDSRSCFLETLTTLQLAARILHLRRRSLKVAASSSGGDSSCEEAPPPPPLHRLTPDTRRFSSGSEHSCDTVIYIGPGGAAVLDREPSDHEGSASFIPIIPSLNRKRAKDTRRSDGDHFKCSTFAELQERLDCIDGPSGAMTDTPSPRTWSRSLWENLGAADRQQVQLVIGAEEGKLSAAVLLQPGSSQDSQRAVREKVLDPEPSVGGALSSTAPKAPAGRHLSEASGLRVELNGEDELVFAFDEDFLHSSVPDNGRPPNLLRSPLEASSSQPVSIISSINDEFDAYTSPQLAEAVDPPPPGPKWGGAVSSSDRTARVHPLSATYLEEDNTASEETQPCRDPKTFLTDSDADSDPAPPNKHSLTTCPASPDPTRATLVPAPHRARKTKQTSPGGNCCHLDPQDNSEILSSGKPPTGGRADVSSQRSGGTSSSVPWLADGFEKFSRRGGTLIKLPRLPRGAATLGTVSTPQSSKSKRGHDGNSVVRMLRLSSLGKKNGQKSSLVQMSRPGNTRLPTPPVRQSRQEEKKRTAVPSSGLKMSSNTGKFLKASTSGESPVGESSSVRRSFSLKIRRADAESTSASRAASPGLTASASHPRQVRGGAGNNSPSASSTRLKVRTLLNSSCKSPSSSPNHPAGRNGSLPPTGRSPAHAGAGTQTRRATIMGTKHAISSLVSELAATRKHLNRYPGSEAIDGGTSSAGESPLGSPLASPYSKITAPRRPRRHSSVLSGELPTAVRRATLFHHSDGSSGYDSMRHDSETTGSVSSVRDSSRQRRALSTNKSRTSKSPKKRGNGFLRRRLIAAPPPDACSVGGQWADLPPLSGTMRQNFQIKVYEIDDVERLQRRTEEVTGSEGLLDLTIWFRMLEKRQQQIKDLRNKHQQLMEELQEAKIRILVPPSRWSGQFDVDQDLDQDSQEYLEVLTRVTAQLEICVNLCKSRVLMETSFDITSWRMATPLGGRQDEDERKGREEDKTRDEDVMRT